MWLRSPGSGSSLQHWGRVGRLGLEALAPASFTSVIDLLPRKLPSPGTFTSFFAVFRSAAFVCGLGEVERPSWSDLYHSSATVRRTYPFQHSRQPFRELWYLLPRSLGAPLYRFPPNVNVEQSIRCGYGGEECHQASGWSLGTPKSHSNYAGWSVHLPTPVAGETESESCLL